MPFFSPEITTCPGLLKFAGTTAASLTCAQASSTSSSEPPRTAAIVPGRSSQAFCMASARFATSLRPASNVMAPVAVSAENSPSECPAAISGLPPWTLAIATESRNTAGCVTFVCLRSSAVPLNITSVMLKPRISFALRNIDFTSAFDSNKSLPIPGN